jgi:hypothetical protein
MSDQRPAIVQSPASPGGHARISGWALAALLCSMVAFCPVLTLLGPLLALRALVQIKARPDVFRGTRHAVAAIVLGLVFSLGWFIAGLWWNANVRRPLLDGPADELRAGLAGDIARFKSGFHQSEATSDAEADTFLKEMRRRYGDALLQLKQSEDKTRGQLPEHGPARIPYVLRFNRREVQAEAEFIITEAGRPPMILKWGWIRIIDPAEGDLVYPVSDLASAKPQATP